MFKNKHSLIKSFEFAFNGLKIALIQGRNFRIQIFGGILALFFGILLKLNYFEWLILILIITFILILELINTSLEAIVDIISPEFQEKAGLAKDVAASAVLLASLVSIITGAILFLPKILNLF